MPCSVTNPKSSDPDYVCNPTTNRWVKRTGKIGKAIPPAPVIIPVTVSPPKKKKVSSKTLLSLPLCEQMEALCPMNTNILGEEWCSIRPFNRNRLVAFDDFKFCTNLDEFFLKLKHTLEPISTMKIPRDPYRFEMYPEKMVDAVYKEMTASKHYPKTPVVQYFMKHYREFYSTLGNFFTVYEDETANKPRVHQLMYTFLTHRSHPYYLVQKGEKWKWNKPIPTLPSFFSS